MSVTSEQVSAPNVRTTTQGSARHLGTMLLYVVVTLAVMAIFTTLIDSPRFSGDEMKVIEYLDHSGPLSGFYQVGGAEGQHVNAFYRPTFVVQVWLYEAVFGMNRIPWQLINLLVHALILAAIFSLVHVLSGRPLFAGLSTLFFGTHWFVNPLVVGYNQDSGMYTTLLILLVLLMFVRRLTITGRRWILLGILLFLAGITRENGLAISLAVGGLGFLGWWLNLVDKKYGLRLLALVSAALVLIIGLRILGVGFEDAFGLDQDTPVVEEAGFFFTEYGNPSVLPESKRLAIYGYTAAANITAHFFPIFARKGSIIVNVVFMVVLAVAVLAAVVFMAARWNKVTAMQRFGLMGGLLLAGGGLLAVSAVLAADRITPRHVTYFFEIIPYVFYNLVTLSALLMAGNVSAWSRSEKSFALLAVLLILAGSVIPFLYFRHRNIRYSFPGWLMLLALLVKYYDPTIFRQKVSYRLTLWSMLSVIAVNIRWLLLGRVGGA